MLFSSEIGNENWPNGSTKVNVFVCPSSNNSMSKECHLWMVGLPKFAQETEGAPPIAKVGGPNQISAGEGLKPDIVGKWTTQVYDIPVNTILKMHVLRSGNGTMRSASILMRFREGAALRRISITTVGNPRSTKNRVQIEGRFDILDPGQASAHGYAIPQHLAASYSPSSYTNLAFLDIVKLSEETVTEPVVVMKSVQNSQGDHVSVPETVRKRALDL